MREAGRKGPEAGKKTPGEGQCCEASLTSTHFLRPNQPGLPRTDLILELAALPPGACPSWHPGMAGHPESSLEVSLLSLGVGPSVGTALELGILATHFSGQESQEQVPRWRMAEGAGSSGVSEGLDIFHLHLIKPTRAEWTLKVKGETVFDHVVFWFSQANWQVKTHPCLQGGWFQSVCFA